MDPSVISQPGLLVKLTKERTELETISQLFHRYQEILKQLDEAAHMLADPSAGAELHSLATEETAQLRAERDDLERQVLGASHAERSAGREESASWRFEPEPAGMRPPCLQETSSACTPSLQSSTS